MASATNGTIMGHPRGLYVLFFTEMWERFSYYGMRVLLVLYMVNYFKWTQADASSVYKWYTSLVYLTPLLGGYLADRYLGNKRAIIIGAVLMAIGHFLMAFEQHGIFYTALAFLIIGNGFFKPNMSTQVGRLYPANDPRRDGAYTIFYMGINLGAFASPLVCGWLQVNTKWSYHAGFAAAGVGMLLGLATYLFFIRWVEEVPDSVVYQGPTGGDDKAKSGGEHYMTEEEARTAPAVFPRIAAAAPALLLLMMIGSVVGAVVLWSTNMIKMNDAVAMGLGGGFACGMGYWITKQLRVAVRERVLAIFVVAVFVVFFWGAFEQAGNAMNLFADKTTNRYLTEEPLPPSIYPATSADPSAIDGGFLKNFNPVPTGWFQSINALAIFLLAPVFAWMWLYLPRHGINLSIPAKVMIGVALQSAAFVLMWWAISFENQPSSTPLAGLPAGMRAEADGRVVFRDAPELSDEDALASFTEADLGDGELHVVNGGRIHYDAATGELSMRGVLADTDRDRLLRATVSPSYLIAIKDLAQETKDARGERGFAVYVELPTPPDGFDLRFSGFTDSEVRYDANTGRLVATIELQDKDYKSLLVAGADPAFRNALNTLYVASAKFKVSALWLFWFYILCTLGELCLSPVGLSMVSKLAPAKFATMLMGMWLLTSFFGNFIAGFAGEAYGTIHPAEYFLLIAIAVGLAAAACFFVIKKTKAMMHGIN